MIPLRVPMATVRFNTKSNTMRAIPANMENKMIPTVCTGHSSGHGIHRELPRDKLKLSEHVPHRVPERPLAHCESAPFSMLKFMYTLSESVGLQ